MCFLFLVVVTGFMSIMDVGVLDMGLDVEKNGELWNYCILCDLNVSFFRTDGLLLAKSRSHISQTKISPIHSVAHTSYIHSFSQSLGSSDCHMETESQETSSMTKRTLSRSSLPALLFLSFCFLDLSVCTMFQDTTVAITLPWSRFTCDSSLLT